MIIKFFLSFGLGLIVLYYLVNSKRTPVATAAALIGGGGAFVFVWAPEIATDVAQLLGVGRGADLTFYCWGLVSLALFLSIHFKFRQLSAQITQLTREAAIANVKTCRATTHC